LVTCRGTQLKIGLVLEESDGAVISSNLIGIRPLHDVLPPVLFAYLNSAAGISALRGRSRSSTLTLALSPKSVGRIEVPVPPLEIQRQIAELVQAGEDNYTAAIGAAAKRRMVAHEVANNLLVGALAGETAGRR
jgi:restriction endonuclease S subunit